MLKGFKTAAVIAAVCLLLSGCSGSRHLKDLVIVEGMGIDKSDSGISLSVQTLNVGINNASQTPEGNMTVNTKKDGSTVSDGVNNLSKSLSKRIFFGQNRLVVIGKSLAESGISQNLDYFMRSADARPDVAVCVSLSDANDIIESKESDASVPCENILYLIDNNQKSGLSILITANEILNLYADETSDIFMPVLEKKKDENVSTAGIGIFKGDKLVDITDDDETAGFVMIMSKAEDIYIEAEDEEFGKTGVKLSEIHCKKTARFSNGEVIFSVGITADMIIDEVENGVDAELSSQSSQRLTQLVEKRVEELCTKAYEACRDNSSDCLRVGEELAKDDMNAYGALSRDWEKYFTASRIECECDIYLKKISDNTQVE